VLRYLGTVPVTDAVQTSPTPRRTSY